MLKTQESRLFRPSRHDAIWVSSPIHNDLVLTATRDLRAMPNALPIHLSIRGRKLHSRPFGSLKLSREQPPALLLDAPTPDAQSSRMFRPADRYVQPGQTLSAVGRRVLQSYRHEVRQAVGTADPPQCGVTQTHREQ